MDEAAWELPEASKCWLQSGEGCNPPPAVSDTCKTFSGNIGPSVPPALEMSSTARLCDGLPLPGACLNAVVEFRAFLDKRLPEFS